MFLWVLASSLDVGGSESLLSETFACLHICMESMHSVKSCAAVIHSQYPECLRLSTVMLNLPFWTSWLVMSDVTLLAFLVAISIGAPRLRYTVRYNFGCTQVHACPSTSGLKLQVATHVHNHTHIGTVCIAYTAWARSVSHPLWQSPRR